jgi:hypothetical protein
MKIVDSCPCIARYGDLALLVRMRGVQRGQLPESKVQSLLFAVFPISIYHIGRTTAGKDPLQNLALVHEEVARQERNYSRSAPLSSPPRHLLPAAAHEVLAPCMIQHLRKLPENWSAFLQQILPRYKSFLLWHVPTKSLVFALSDPGKLRLEIHCACGRHLPSLYSLRTLSPADDDSIANFCSTMQL